MAERPATPCGAVSYRHSNAGRSEGPSCGKGLTHRLHQQEVVGHHDLVTTLSQALAPGGKTRPRTCFTLQMAKNSSFTLLTISGPRSERTTPGTYRARMTHSMRAREKYPLCSAFVAASLGTLRRAQW